MNQEQTKRGKIKEMIEKGTLVKVKVTYKDTTKLFLLPARCSLLEVHTDLKKNLSISATTSIYLTLGKKLPSLNTKQTIGDLYEQFANKNHQLVMQCRETSFFGGKQ